MITLTSGGVVYKHKLEAVPGDLWVSTISPIAASLVAIVKVDGHYIDIEPMAPDTSIMQLHASQFYTQFMKVTKYTRKSYKNKTV